MTALQRPDDLSLEERVRDAEQAVVLQDRRLQQTLDEVSRHTREVARSSGRALLGAAGAGLGAWLLWRLVRGRRPPHERAARAAARDEARSERRHADRSPGGWQRLLSAALVIAPFVMPASAPAAGAVDALAPGRRWPQRLARLLRAAFVWLRRDAPAGRVRPAASRPARPPAPR